MSSKKKVVVIGNGMVGHRFIEELVNNDPETQFEISTFCEESRLAYDRVHLTSYFSGNSAEDLSLVKPGFYEDNGIQVFLEDKATEIDLAKKTVKSAKGAELTYDKLILATGSFPFVPPVPGHERDNCFVYRTLEDLDKIAAAAKTGKVGAVVGGGLLGLEAAKALKDLGLETHVVEFAPRLMAVQVDEGGGAVLRSKIQELGVRVHTEKNTKEIIDGDGTTHKMCFADGEELNTDIIVFSAGIRPQDELARSSGLELGPRGGISINNSCQTSDPDVYAIGECALWDQRIFGLIAPGWQMSKVAADHLVGNEAAFTGADMSTKLKLMGVDVASVGDAHGRTEGSRSFSYNDEINQIYKKIVVSSDNKKLLGAVLVGDAEEYGTLLQLMLNQIDIPGTPEGLILPQGDGAAPGLGVDMLPETAQICSCNNVTKGDLCSAIDGGVTGLAELKACTNAATGCGGCSALVKQVLDSELEKQGIEVDRSICEHFKHTRQELYHLVRAGQIHSFGELLSKHGTGHGCEICRPAVGNILASCWNKYILETENTPLQDTNDNFLANMQKDGTYSVVPRIPGGEITPEGLIVIGQVAKKYDLYTKITGGQRIDMFGARVDQLPHIWKELVDAGFETGHAYGKAMRTVKSCVGSTWCRYGMDDSVGLAIEVENRYRGLRSPHKIKLAVSGCTRECAEAQSKDVGIIATENGWNMYVCGNGGMKPRHGDLFASDLDKETLLKYIDRFFMFYIRTADRLQRTSVWMENLEGGLSYLQDVIINDSLGLGDQLESEMQIVIDNYECEWKRTIEDDNAQQRFTHFVNSKKADPSVVFVRERQQIRPAREEEKANKHDAAIA